MNDSANRAPDHSVRWTTELFDYRGEIPEEHNAGNRFYGRDVAAFLAEKLRSDDVSTDFIDEDWGWLVMGRSPNGRSFEIAVYNLGDDGSQPRVGAPEWGLWVRMFEKRPWLVFLHRNRRIPCEEWLLNRLAQIEREASIVSAPWDDSPGGNA